MALALQDDKLVASTLDGITKISCQCCIPLQFSYAFNPILYSGGVLQCVAAFGGQDGPCCDTGWPYVSVFETGADGEVLVAEAKRDGLWSSTANIDFYAIWLGDSDIYPYQPYPGGTLSVTYLGVTKSVEVPTMSEGVFCVDIGFVKTVVVSASPIEDGSFFKFV
jgi:hypothetical protein